MKKTVFIIAAIVCLSVFMAIAYIWQQDGEVTLADWPLLVILAVLELIAFLISFFVCESLKIYDLEQKLKKGVLAASSVLILILSLNIWKYCQKREYMNEHKNLDSNESLLNGGTIGIGPRFDSSARLAVKVMEHKQKRPNDYRIIAIFSSIKDSVIDGDSEKVHEINQLYNIGTASKETIETLHICRHQIFEDGSIKELFDLPLKYALNRPELNMYKEYLEQIKGDLGILKGRIAKKP